MTVKGGLTIESGTLNIFNATVEASKFHATSTDDTIASPYISIDSQASYLSNSMMHISAQKAQNAEFAYFSAGGTMEAPIYSVQGDGSIVTQGGAYINGEQGLSVQMHSYLSGGISISRIYLPAGKDINIPMNASYIVITDDNDDKSINSIHFASQSSHAHQYTQVPSGHIMIVSNFDAQDTSGDVEIPANSTVMFVFNGEKYVDVQALHAPIHVSLDCFSHIYIYIYMHRDHIFNKILPLYLHRIYIVSALSPPNLIFIWATSPYPLLAWHPLSCPKVVCPSSARRECSSTPISSRL